MARDGLSIKIIGQCHSGGSVLEGIGTVKLSDLRGKIIGVPGLRSVENLGLIQTLSEEKLRYGLDYKTIKVPFSIVMQYFRQGKIGAIYFPEPYGSMAEIDHIAHQMEPGTKILSQGLTTVLAVRVDFLQEKHRKALAEWIGSITKACDYIEHDISDLSAEQTAIIQEPYMGFARALVSDALVKRRGGIQFSFTMPEKKQIKLYQEQALSVEVLDKRIDIDTLFVSHAFSANREGHLIDEHLESYD